MDWLVQNWIWVVLFALFIGMHLFGHGGGRDEQNPRAENSRAGSGRKATIKENHHAEHQARFLGARVVGHGHPLPDPAEQAASGVPPSSVVPRACAARSARATSAGSRRAGDEQERLAHRLRQGARGVPQRRRHPAWTGTASRPPTTVSISCSRTRRRSTICSRRRWISRSGKL